MVAYPSTILKRVHRADQGYGLLRRPAQVAGREQEVSVYQMVKAHLGGVSIV